VQVEQLIALLKNTNLAGIGESARPSPFYRLLLFHLCLDVTVLAFDLDNSTHPQRGCC
jgi:hypothetical protein